MKLKLKPKNKKKITPVIINPPIKKENGENIDVFESHSAGKSPIKTNNAAVPPKKTAHAAKVKKKKHKTAQKTNKGLLKGSTKKRKFYTVTVKSKDKTTKVPKSQTLNIRAKSEVDAYNLAKRYYTNAKSNKVRLDKKRNKTLKNEEFVSESLMKRIAMATHNLVFDKSPLTSKIEAEKRRQISAPKPGKDNGRDEEYDVHDSKGTHVGTHKNYADAANHAKKEGGHLVVRTTHVTKYHVVHNTGSGVGVATYKTGKKGKETTHYHTYDSIHKARNAIAKHGLDPAKHRIAAIRTKVQ